MKIAHLLFVLFLLGITFPSAGYSNKSQQEIPVKKTTLAHNMNVYVGQRGVQVWTLRMHVNGKEEALVQIRGLENNPWDMWIFRCAIERNSSTERFIAQSKGQPFTLLTLSVSPRLFIPESTLEYVLFGELTRLSETGNPLRFLEAYIEQTKVEKVLSN